MLAIYDAVNGYQIQSFCIFLSKWNSKKVLVRFLVNKTFKIVGNVLKVQKEEKHFISYSFQNQCILSRNLKETSKDIFFS